jgi:hypothetical protein
VAVGALIAGLCGLCTWSFADSLHSQTGGMSSVNAWGLALLFGGVPILAGLAIAGADLALLIELRRKPKRPQ